MAQDSQGSNHGSTEPARDISDLTEQLPSVCSTYCGVVLPGRAMWCRSTGVSLTDPEIRVKQVTFSPANGQSTLSYAIGRQGKTPMSDRTVVATADSDLSVLMYQMLASFDTASLVEADMFSS